MGHAQSDALELLALHGETPLLSQRYHLPFRRDIHIVAFTDEPTTSGDSFDMEHATLNILTRLPV